MAYVNYTVIPEVPVIYDFWNYEFIFYITYF